MESVDKNKDIDSEWGKQYHKHKDINELEMMLENEEDIDMIEILKSYINSIKKWIKI